MTDDSDLQQQQDLLKKKLEELTLEHRDLDDLLGIASGSPSVDMLKIQRLKKRKLAIKDEIRSIHSRILPDIIA
jgi:hypothetical protein